MAVSLASWKPLALAIFMVEDRKKADGKKPGAGAGHRKDFKNTFRARVRGSQRPYHAHGMRKPGALIHVRFRVRLAT